MFLTILQSRPDSGAGSGGKGKHHIPQWDMAWQREFERPLEPSVTEDALLSPEIERGVSPEVVEVVNAKAEAQALAQAIISHRRETSRIRSQMRLSSNAAALAVMEAEIGKIEAHLAKVKREAEDMLVLTLLM